MKRLAIVIILSQLIVGCSKDNPVSGDANGDAVLKSLLIGTWSSGKTYRITYYPDGSFVDSSYGNPSSDTTVYTLIESRVGKYVITNSIIERTEMHIAYYDTTRMPGGFLESPIGQEVQIDFNRLNMKLVDVYSLIQGTGTELSGTWTITKWVCSNMGGASHKIYEGRRRETFSFAKDSSHLAYSCEYLDSNGPSNETITGEYSYEPPMLNSAHPLIVDRKVEFKNGKMYWYMGLIISPMIKQQ